MKDINKINIKIEVAGRQYPISTPREDEEALRRVRDENDKKLPRKLRCEGYAGYFVSMCDSVGNECRETEKKK